MLRSVFNYHHRPAEFLDWCRAVGALRLRNSPDFAAFIADKRYLSQLSVATVPTAFVGWGDPLPELVGDVVIKPNISAGGRDTGRFSEATYEAARALVERICAGGGIALVQPYVADVDRRGETALVFFRGELSHVLRKRAVLRPDEVAPVAHEGLGSQFAVAQAMFDEDLVVPGEADLAEQEFAGLVLAEVTERFGIPTVLRVDLVNDTSGSPVLMEIEAIDPVLYLATCPGASGAFAAAVRAS